MTLKVNICPKRPRVLIAEDHPGVAKAVCRMLALDCDVVGTLADGSAVLEAAQRLQPDVIVVDLNLPYVHGLEASRQIKQVKPELMVIVFSAMNDPDLKQRSVEVGASAFVSKGTGDLEGCKKWIAPIERQILVLRHELAMLRRKIRRPAIRPIDRLFLTAASRLLPPARWQAFVITPATLLRWHQRLVARRWTYTGRRGRRPIQRDVRMLAVRLARENPPHGGDDLAAAVVCPVLHRTGESSSASRRLYADADSGLAYATGAAADVDARRSAGTLPISDSGIGIRSLPRASTRCSKRKASRSCGPQIGRRRQTAWRNALCVPSGRGASIGS